MVGHVRGWETFTLRLKGSADEVKPGLQEPTLPSNCAQSLPRINWLGLEDVCEKATNPEVSVELEKRYFMMRVPGNLNFNIK